MIGITVIVTIVLIILFYLLLKKVIMPLKNLRETAEQIAAGELSEDFEQQDHGRRN